VSLVGNITCPLVAGKVKGVEAAIGARQLSKNAARWPQCLTTSATATVVLAPLRHWAPVWASTGSHQSTARRRSKVGGTIMNTSDILTSKRSARWRGLQYVRSKKAAAVPGPRLQADERVQKIGQELADNLNSWAAEFVAADRTGAWVRSN
jgi:hypothetical protein